MGITTAITAGLESLGAGAATAGIGATALEGAGIGAGLGGLESAFTGGNVGQGILHGGEGGALTGGGIGLGGNLIGGAAGDVIGGTAGGALGAKVTGGNPLTGAVEGGISGGIASALSPSGTPSTTSAAPASGGAGISAGGAAAPSGVAPDTAATGSFDTTSLNNTISSLQNAGDVGSAATSGTNVGTGAVGTQNLPSGGSVVNTGGVSNFDTTSLNNTISSLQNTPGASSGVSPASPSSVSQFLSNPSFSNAGNVVTSNPGAAISAAGLGLDVLNQNKNLEGEKALKAEAAQDAGQGAQLESYLQSGTLPPGLQASIDQQTQSAIAAIKSRFAAQGASGSSAEQQEISAVQAQAQAAGAQMAEQLLSTGIQETGMSSQLYDELMKQASANDTNLSGAIANFASAASGGSGAGGITLSPGMLQKLTGSGGNATQW